MVILIFCSLDVSTTEISRNILSLSPPVIGVLVWLILDGLTTNYPCWSMWVWMLVAEFAQVRLHEKLTRQYEPRSFTRAHSSSNSLALL